MSKPRNPAISEAKAAGNRRRVKRWQEKHREQHLAYRRALYARHAAERKAKVNSTTGETK